MQQKVVRVLWLSALLSNVGVCSAGIAWNESINGDLSNNRSNPTAVTVGTGSNLLIATSGGPGPDRDYFRFTIPAGYQLTGIYLNQYTSLFDGKAFIGVQTGSAITVNPTDPSPAPLLGYAHFGPDVELLTPPFNYLSAIGTGVSAIGFTGPLGPGEYSFWTQQTSAGSPSTYQLDFVVEPVATPDDVPIPGGALLIQGALLAAIGYWRLGRRPGPTQQSL
jgi:hypothetical protein